MEVNPMPVSVPVPPPKKSEEDALEKKVWGWKNRLFIWINTILMSLILLAILIGANVAAKKFYKRWDITAAQKFQVSGYTVSLLSKLKKEVTIYVTPFQQDVHDYALNIHSLFQEFGKYNSRIQVVRVDFRDLGLITFLQTKWPNMRPNDIVFVSGEKSKIVDARETYIPNTKEFKGEAVFSAAIEEVIRGDKAKVYFTAGHGEANPRGVTSPRDLSSFTRLLEERGNCTIQELSLLTAREIPADCSVLAVIDPQKKFPDHVLEMLRKYVDRGGRMIVTIGIDLSDYPRNLKNLTGLEKFLEPYGIQIYQRDKRDYSVVTDCIMDQPLELGQRVMPGYIARVLGHGMTGGKLNEGMGQNWCLLPFAPSVRAMEKAPDHIVTRTLMRTPETAWAEWTSLDTMLKKEPKRNPGIEDDVSPSVAVESEIIIRGAGAGESGTKAKHGRIIVIGSGLFLSNMIEQYAEYNPVNVEYGLNCFKYLQEREEEIVGIPPKKIVRSVILLENDDMRAKFDRGIWLYALVLPSVGIILGIIAWISRRK